MPFAYNQKSNVNAEKSSIIHNGTIEKSDTSSEEKNKKKDAMTDVNKTIIVLTAKTSLEKYELFF
ncbi:hypothetical protein PA25_26150 [Pseudoalteromonas sp. A25]|nr:hypothetical protein PA25_26150 [Pseudoalteromonas sp. A25]